MKQFIVPPSKLRSKSRRAPFVRCSPRRSICRRCFSRFRSLCRAIAQPEFTECCARLPVPTEPRRTTILSLPRELERLERLAHLDRRHARRNARRTSNHTRHAIRVQLPRSLPDDSRSPRVRSTESTIDLQPGRPNALSAVCRSMGLRRFWSRGRQLPRWGPVPGQPLRLPGSVAYSPDVVRTRRIATHLTNDMPNDRQHDSRIEQRSDQWNDQRNDPRNDPQDDRRDDQRIDQQNDRRNVLSTVASAPNVLNVRLNESEALTIARRRPVDLLDGDVSANAVSPFARTRNPITISAEVVAVPVEAAAIVRRRDSRR